jgi:hypothetical protein
MSKLRTDALETLDSQHTKNVADLIDDINEVQVTTSTGEQTLVGALDSRVTQEYASKQEYYLTVETFGATDTPSNTYATMQTAIDFCAANGILLRAKSPEYTIDVSAGSITIPSNFRCDLGNAWIKRATGNTTPHDMWVNADITNGNSGLDIRNVRFDGQRQTDALSRDTSTHRFCGLRLVKCSGHIENVRADNTVNGETQAEGTRAGIIFDNCGKGLSAAYLYADGTDGSGIFVTESSCRVAHVKTANNTGSGFTSARNNNSVFIDIESDGSGYSGISINGKYMQCFGLRSKNSPSGYAGINIGHESSDNQADHSVIVGAQVESADGWGITIAGSTDVKLIGYQVNAAQSDGVRIFSSSQSCTLMAGSVRNCAGLGISVRSGTKHCLIASQVSGCGSSGVSIIDGAEMNIDNDTRLVSNAQNLTPSTGNLSVAGAGSKCRHSAINESSGVDGIVSSGSAVVYNKGGQFSENTGNNFTTATGGVIRHERAVIGNDPLIGQFTAGGSSTTVSNDNAVSINNIRITPLNSAARALDFNVASVSQGVSFTINFASAPAGTEVFAYSLD